MSQVLYRKYRSKTLQDIVGQNHITSVLQKSLDKNIISHAYLFTGPRGVGKTSIARILARSINGLEPEESSLDIIEIDAASNNGVDNIRDLRDKAQIAPTTSPKKVYIIDEVHMLSGAAFNALLKTLEEPPAHVVFILATTNLDKLPDTVISRTQHFTFRPIPTNDITSHLKQIAKKEKLKISEDAIKTIAYQADGGLRDALSMLNQLASLSSTKNNISDETVIDTLGLAPTKSLDLLLKYTIANNFSKTKQTLEELSSSGVSGANLLSQLLNHIASICESDSNLIILLKELSHINKNDSFVDLRILATLGLYSGKNQSKDAAKTPPKAASTKVVAQAVSTPKNPATVIASNPENLENFKWESLIESVKSKHIALGGLIVKCKHELDTTEQKLTLYTVNKFNKKKLDDPKYSPHIYSALSDLGFNNLTVETIPKNPPFKDNNLNRVANIMGGGEAVEVNL